MKKRFVPALLVSIAALSLLPASTFAHVNVTPAQVGIGEHVIFNVSVPNEKDVDVTSLKLSIPNGITDVTPTTKEGWSIDENPLSIVWSGGAIPAGQRQDFSFSAQVPAQAADLHWKAYQTYADGTTVSWDQAGDDEKENAGPYSVTSVIDDLSDKKPTFDDDSLPIVLSVIALFVSVLGIILSRKHA